MRLVESRSESAKPNPQGIFKDGDRVKIYKTITKK